MPASDRIVTRSQAKLSTPLRFPSPTAPPPITDFLTLPYKDPDQYTIVPAPLKIVKVLIEELLSAQGKLGTASSTAAAAIAADFDAVEDDGDEGWEDDPDTLDLGMGTTKSDLMGYLEGGGRQRDDETQAYLTDFFLRCARDNTAGFKDYWYEQLTDQEKAKLNELAS